MNYKFKGSFHDYCIEDDKITISKKKEIIYSGNISDIIVLCFIENNIFGAGQIVLSLPDRKKVFAEGFRKNDRENFIKMFQILIDKTEFLDLDYVKAMAYVKPEIQREKDLQKIAKEKQKEIKKELQKEDLELKKQGYKLIEETKCICTQCSAVWVLGKQDKADDISNRLISLGAYMQGKSLTGTYHEQLIKDKSKCPKCGSRAITSSKVKYWFNNRTGKSIEYKS